MKSILSVFKECVVSYDKVQEDGTQKRVSEKYIVCAMSFTEAEARITEEMSGLISGGFEVVNISPLPFGEVFIDETGEKEKYYKAKLAFITLDENSGKEKKTRVHYLVQADSVADANKALEEMLKGTMIDYVIEEVKETSYLDVFEKEDKK